MFRLTVVYGPGPTICHLTFKSEEAAQSCQKVASDSMASDWGCALQDEFGQVAVLRDVRGVILENLDLTGDAANQINLVMARAQARYNELIMSDPDPALKRAINNQRIQAARSGMAGMGPGPFPPN